MQNPWHLLPETAPFVLPCDRESILNFNALARPGHEIHLEILPEPFLGNPQAKVILLNLNPGFAEIDRLSLNDRYFMETNRANLRHGPQEYPFYLLNPKNALSSGGFHWWETKLRTLIARYDFKKLANEICVIEYFPYHSAKFSFRQSIPSQRYGFYLVEEAMKRNALIIQMRSRAVWQNALPALKGYQNYYVLRNPQNVAMTEGNCPDGYPEILKLLG